jgi:hypothetical protein
MELRGRHVMKARSALWYTVPGNVLMSQPYRGMLNPDPTELRAMIGETCSFGARFPFSTWAGLESGFYLLRHRELNQLLNVVLNHSPVRAVVCTALHIRPQARQLETLQQSWKAPARPGSSGSYANLPSKTVFSFLALPYA